MSVLSSPPVVCERPRRGVWWVLQAAVAALAIAAWIIVLLHLALIVRAELKLAEIVRQANAFADLPGVDSRELAGYARRRLSAAGFGGSRIQVAPHPTRVGQLHVTRIEAAADTAVPRPLRPLGQWLEKRPLQVGGERQPAPLFHAAE